MIAEDLYENLLRQRLNIMDATKKSNRLLFVDTDAITTLFYSRFLLSEPKQLAICEKMAAAICDMTAWDLVLFLEPDVAFVQDGTRNETIHADREKYSQQIKQALSEVMAQQQGWDVNVEFRGELAALARILAPVITKEQRNLEYLKKIVRRIYEAIKVTENKLYVEFPQIEPMLPEDIFFIHSDFFTIQKSDIISTILRFVSSGKHSSLQRLPASMWKIGI